MVSVLYTHFEKPFAHDVWDRYFALLPETMHKRILRYVRWQDRHANLLSNLLLIEGFRKFDISPQFIQKIKLTDYKKPYIEANVDFSISHAGEYVVCGFSDEGRIGVDIEKIRKIEIDGFKDFFSEDQWKMLTDDFCLRNFFKLWTSIESVMKWDGRGMYLDVRQIEIAGERVEVEGNSCYLHNVDVDAEYLCCLTTEKSLKSFTLDKLTFGDS